MEAAVLATDPFAGRLKAWCVTATSTQPVGVRLNSPKAIWRALDALRRGMKPRDGKEWTSLRFEIDADGKFDVSFTY
jgi:hypothetical protein